MSYTSDTSATIEEIATGLNAALGTALATRGINSSHGSVTTNGGGDGIRVNAVSADFDFTLSAGATVGLTASTYTSTSLLDNIATAGQYARPSR